MIIFLYSEPHWLYRLKNCLEWCDFRQIRLFITLLHMELILNCDFYLFLWHFTVYEFFMKFFSDSKFSSLFIFKSIALNFTSLISFFLSFWFLKTFSSWVLKCDLRKLVRFYDHFGSSRRSFLNLKAFIANATFTKWFDFYYLESEQIPLEKASCWSLLPFLQN